MTAGRWRSKEVAVVPTDECSDVVVVFCVELLKAPLELVCCCALRFSSVKGVQNCK